MPIFSLIIGLVILVVMLLVSAFVYIIGQTLWSLLCVTVVHRVRPKGKRAAWLCVLIPLFAPAYLTALILLVWWGWPDKHNAYAIAFGSSPSPTVVLHEGDISGWGDSMEIELRFNAHTTEIQKMTGAAGLSLDPGYASASNGVAQTRFGTIRLLGKDVYTGPGLSQGFATENAVLIYDPATGEAWYTYTGLD